MQKTVVLVFSNNDRRDYCERLSEGVRIFTGDKSQCVKAGELKRSGLGKPYFATIPVEFSVSHTGRIWLAAFSDKQVGIDAEMIRDTYCGAISRRFFSRDERRYAEAYGKAGFFAVWSAKESFVKYTGNGIDDGFRELSVADESGLVRSLDGAWFSRIALVPDAEICLCTEEPTELAVYDMM